MLSYVFKYGRNQSFGNGIRLKHESTWVGWCECSLATGAGVVVAFGMGEDGDGLVKEEREAWLEGDPFVFIDLDGELLDAPLVSEVWEAAHRFVLSPACQMACSK